MSDDAVQQESQTGAGHDLSPLDPYVDRVVRWFAATKGGMPANGLAAAIAAQFDWPVPFAEAILVSVNGRRLLRPNRMSSRPSRLMLSRRGLAWLDERSESNEKRTTI
jgi:hypothetical protein